MKERRLKTRPDDDQYVATERTLPHNAEAERSVLGAILLHNDAYEKVAAILGAEDFYRDANRRIFAAMDRLLEWKDGTADMVTLKEELGKRGELTEVGGPAYIAGLVDGVMRSTNVEHYARIIRDKAQLRRLISTANVVLTDAYEAAEPADDILGKADKALVELVAGYGTSRTGRLRDTRQSWLDDLEHRTKHQGELSGIETGFASVDELTLGWQPGELIVLGARPSIGKTSFILNSAVAAAKTGKRVAIFSLEMSRKQLEFRMVSSYTNVPLTRLLSGRLMEPDWAPISAAMAGLYELPIHINDASGLTIGQVRSECRRIKSDEGNLDCVIIDYVQLMGGMLEDRQASANERLTDTSRRAKILADELGAPVIMLSQLSRANEKRTDPRPKLSDLRESGALEQDPDLVCFLHRKNHREGGLTYFIVEKQRNGPTGTLKLSLDRDVVRFTDAPDLAEPQERRAQQQERDRYGSDS